MVNIIRNESTNVDIEFFSKVGQITIISDPAEASIYFDNKFVGTTPSVLRNIPAGKHDIRLETDKYGHYEEINVVGGKKEKLNYSLQTPIESLVYPGRTFNLRFRVKNVNCAYFKYSKQSYSLSECSITVFGEKTEKLKILEFTRAYKIENITGDVEKYSASIEGTCVYTIGHKVGCNAYFCCRKYEGGGMHCDLYTTEKWGYECDCRDPVYEYKSLVEDFIGTTEFDFIPGQTDVIELNFDKIQSK